MLNDDSDPLFDGTQSMLETDDLRITDAVMPQHLSFPPFLHDRLKITDVHTMKTPEEFPY